MAVRELPKTVRHPMLWARVMSSAALILQAGACGPSPPPPPREMAEAARVIREMSSPSKLEAVGFYEIYPSPKPSDFVRFVSSQRGAGLWPPRQGSPLVPALDTYRRDSTGGSLLPKGIAYRRNRPDPRGGRQIIYRADDRRGEVVVEGYTDPSTEPVLVLRWRFPR